MNRKLIKEKIVSFVQESIGVELEGEEDLREEGIDSLSLVMLVTGMEEVFAIEFNDDDLDPDKLTSLENLVDLVEKYI